MIFVDTSFWLALAIPADDRHPDGRALFALHGRTPLTTTNLVLGETWTFVRRRFGHRIAVTVTDLVEGSPRVEVVRVDTESEREAWEWLRRHDEREYSYVDATSFAVMRRRALRDVLTFDSDFAAAGFVVVAPP